MRDDMACDRCGESRRLGYAFCMHCGEPLDSCPDCEESRGKGMRFCPTCGRPLEIREPPSVLQRLALLAVPVTVLLILFEIVAMVAGVPTAWSWAADGWMKVNVLVPRLESVGSIGGTGLQLFWIILVVALLASAYLVARQTLPAVREKGPDMEERLWRTPLCWIAVLLCADILLNIVIGLVFLDEALGSAEGLETGFNGPSLMTFANAAVWEEVISRVAYIGVPMTVIAALCRRRDFPKYLLGGFGMSRATLVLIVVSATVFGFAHQSGWGDWKILPTFLSGLALGYLYVRFGIHASIMFHFAVDYLAVLMVDELLPVVGLFEVAMIVLGIPCLIEVIRRMYLGRRAVLTMPNLVPEDQERSFWRRE